MEKEKFLSSVYLIIRNDKNEILLQRRKGTKLWPGFLALPAGHAYKGENVYDAAFREAKEELGIEITLDSVIDTFVVNRRNKTLSPYYDVYFEINDFDGEIKVNEPEKCFELVWCDINNLPNDMIDFEIEAINKNKLGVKFSVIDTDDKKKIK